MNQAELEYEKKNNTITEFTNVDTQSFTHSYNGVQQSIEPGAKIPMRLPMAEHFAEHLARRMVARAKTKDQMKKDDSYYTSEEVNELIPKIYKVISTENSEHLTDQEVQKRDTEELRKKYPAEQKEEAKTEEPKVSKQQAIKHLRELGEDPDTSLPLPELLQLITDLEMNPKPKEE